MAIEHTAEERQARLTSRYLVGGSVVAGISGAATIVAGIIGLAALYNMFWPAIATVILSAAFIVEGGSMAARFSQISDQLRATGTTARTGGSSAEFLIGLGGLALGIIALAGAATVILPHIAVIGYGVALVMASGATSRMSEVVAKEVQGPEATRSAASAAMTAAADIKLMMGLAAIALGILALIGVVPRVLTLAAYLGLGGTMLMVGFAVPGRLMAIFRH